MYKKSALDNPSLQSQRSESNESHQSKPCVLFSSSASLCYSLLFRQQWHSTTPSTSPEALGRPYTLTFGSPGAHRSSPIMSWQNGRPSQTFASYRGLQEGQKQEPAGCPHISPSLDWNYGTLTPRQETVSSSFTGAVVGMQTDSGPRRSAGAPVCVTCVSSRDPC